MTAFPKPPRRGPKPRKPLQRTSRLRPRRPRKSAKASSPAPAYPKPKRPEKTKHARRERDWGYMAMCHSRGCELNLDRDLQKLLGIVHVCEGAREFAHLSDRKRYDVGDVGAVLCQLAHRGFDGKVGGKAIWYVALAPEGQHTVRMRLANRARRAWDLLTPEEREGWERNAEAWRKSRGIIPG